MKKCMLSFFLAILFHNSTGAVTGTLVTPEHQPLQGADISLLGNTQLSATSDENGFFTLDYTSSTGFGSYQSKKRSVYADNGQIILTFSRKEQVKIELFTLGGRKSISLFSGELGAGDHRLELPLEITAHQNIPPGCRITYRTSRLSSA